MLKNKYIKTVLRQILLWVLAFVFWSLMREFGQEVSNGFEQMNILQRIRFQMASGVIAGVLFGSVEFFIERKILKKMPFGKVVLLGSLIYLIAIMLLLLLGMRVFTIILGIELNWEMYKSYIFSRQGALFVFYCFLIGFLIDFFKEVDKKFGPGNLSKMLKGEFYNPKEDERVFMFLDLKSSTAIAEKLGHIEYSKFIQDCFYDLEIVHNYKAEVYQYVGDEAVLTWDKEVGLENSNCLRAFFAFLDLLKSKTDYYQKKYGVIPEFKAGLNVGKITVAEVGEIKREIAYHGDTINTAARIQEKCNEFDKKVLISETLEQNLNSTKDFKRNLVGDVLLKGKLNVVNIYSVERND